jgi:hypothetical protein
MVDAARAIFVPPASYSSLALTGSTHAAAEHWLVLNTYACAAPAYMLVCAIGELLCNGHALHAVQPSHPCNTCRCCLACSAAAVQAVQQQHRTAEGLQAPHGDKLVNLMVPADQRQAVIDSCTKTIECSDRNACDVELLCVG